MTEVKNRSDIAQLVLKNINENSIKKVDIVKGTELSRNTIYKVVQQGGRTEDYSMDNFLKVCKELGLRVCIN